MVYSLHTQQEKTPFSRKKEKNLFIRKAEGNLIKQENCVSFVPCGSLIQLRCIVKRCILNKLFL